jgi:NAD+ kinase
MGRRVLGHPAFALTASSEEQKSHTEETSDTAPNIKAPIARKKKKKKKRPKMELLWCSSDFCKSVVRERTIGEHNQILLNGPATGQVAYFWNGEEANYYLPPPSALHNGTAVGNVDDQIQEEPIEEATTTILLLVKKGHERLMEIAADAVRNLTDVGVQVLLDPAVAARLKHYYGCDRDNIHLWEVTPTPGYGDNLVVPSVEYDGTSLISADWSADDSSEEDILLPPAKSMSNHHQYIPDLICTLGGDGLLMHAGMMFQGPIPPILCVSGGSLGFLTPFEAVEMVDAVRISLGLLQDGKCRPRNVSAGLGSHVGDFHHDIDVFPPNMPGYPFEPLTTEHANNGEPLHEQEASLHQQQTKRLASFGLGDRICLSIRMRLECSIINRQGAVRTRYNVLNEVAVDRGSSPYLVALECFCDDVHLTTVQADGVIFATPTGSTAYSLAAGSSVVHPAVPCILVTPICPHVLSFRPMIFPDHVVLRCFVPDDARSEASVAFDGKHRQALHRGDSLQIKMSPYPVPTINRKDHSSDWLNSLKRNFNFNARPRQQPL